MTLTMDDLWRMLRFTLADPRGAARAVMALDLPMQARWLALILMGVASALVTAISIALLPAADREMLAAQGLPAPLLSAALQVGVMSIAAVMMHRIGAMRGGTGQFADAVILIGWLQFVLLVVQIVQFAAQFLFPPVASLLGLIGIGIFFWLLTSFVAELHGFRSRGLVLAGVFLACIVLAVVLAIVLAPFMAPMTGGV